MALGLFWFVEHRDNFSLVIRKGYFFRRADPPPRRSSAAPTLHCADALPRGLNLRRRRRFSAVGEDSRPSQRNLRRRFLWGLSFSELYFLWGFSVSKWIRAEIMAEFALLRTLKFAQVLRSGSRYPCLLLWGFSLLRFFAGIIIRSSQTQVCNLSHLCFIVVSFDISVFVTKKSWEAFKKIAL